MGINIVYNKICAFLFFWLFILNVFWLIFKNFQSKSIDELRVGQNLNKLYSPKIHLDLTNIFRIACSIFASESIHQIARFQFQKKKRKRKKSSLSRGHIPPDTPLCTPANHSLMSKPDPCLCRPIKKPISEHHLISYYIKGFCRKTCLKNKRKTMRGEVFWGLKNPEKPGASGGSAPWTLPARCPWTKRAPGPHAVKTLRSLRSLYLDTNNFYSAPRSNKSCTGPWQWTYNSTTLLCTVEEAVLNWVIWPSFWNSKDYFSFLFCRLRLS